MRIIEQTPTQLTLEDRPVFQWLMGIFLGIQGVVFLSWGLGSPVSDTLSCHRLENTKINCELTTTLLLGQQNTYHVDQLQGAEVKKTSFLGSKTGQSNLLTATVEVALPLMPIWTVQSTVYQVNQFINSPLHPTLLLTEDNRFDHQILSAFSLIWLGGGVSLLLSPIITSTFSKYPHQVQQTRRNLLGVKSIHQSILPHSCPQVEYYEKTYHLQLDKLSLSNSSGRKKHLEKIAEIIRQFLA